MKISHLTKHFGEKKVFTDYSLDFGNTERIALMGASGSGKTTLLNILLGFYTADEGSIEGFDAGSVSVVFQENRLVEGLTVRANLHAVLGRDFPEEKMSSVLTYLGLSDVLNLEVSKLSGGMKRRVAIARALLYPHQWLLLDEPFKGLDEDTKAQVIRTVNAYSAQSKLLLITHDEEDAKAMGAMVFRI